MDDDAGTTSLCGPLAMDGLHAVSFAGVVLSRSGFLIFLRGIRKER